MTRTGWCRDDTAARDYAFLRAAGVRAIFGPGTNPVDAAAEVLRLLGHNSPPVEA